MSRDANGNYTLPTGNPVITGNTIDSSWANDTMVDIGTELTNSLDRFGKGGMAAPLRLTDGSVTVPAMSFANSTNSGFYRAGLGDIRLSIRGVDAVKVLEGAELLVEEGVYTFSGDGLFQSGAELYIGADASAPRVLNDVNMDAILNTATPITDAQADIITNANAITANANAIDATEADIVTNTNAIATNASDIDDLEAFDATLGTAALLDADTMGTIGVENGSATAPSLNNTGDDNTGLFFPAQDAIAITCGGTERVRVDGNGNVGIGTTSPNRTLQVTGILAATDAGNTASVLIVPTATKNEIFSRASDSSSTAVPLTFKIGNSERVRIDSAGNVGIGTNNPSAKLEVSSDAIVHGLTLGRGASSVSTNTALGDSVLRENTTGGDNTSVGFRALRENTTGDLNSAFGTNALLFNTTGNNNTASGFRALTSNTTGDNNTALGINSGQLITTGSKNTILGGFNGNQNGLDIRTADNFIVIADGDGVPRMVVDDSGNVGIGTVSPAQELHVSGSGNYVSIFESSGSNCDVVFRTSDSTGDNIRIGVQGDALAFRTDNAERMRIADDGNVGIGTESPDALLSVRKDDSGNIADVVVLGNEHSGVTGSGARILFTGSSSSSRGASIQAAVLNSGNGHYLSFSTSSSGSAPSERMRIDDDGNVGIGTDDPLAKLHVGGDINVNDIVIGRGGGNVSNNTAVGESALTSNTSGDRNVAFGANPLQNNTEGLNNTALGYNSLPNNTTGDDNVAIGRDAMEDNTTGQSNTAVGQGALDKNTTGDVSVAVGVNALGKNTTGGNNTAIGAVALFESTDGTENVAVGYRALQNVTTGSGNTAINPMTAAGSYAPVVDPTTIDNRFCMGSTAVTNAYIQVAWTVVSDERDKTDFAPVPHGLDFVNKLNPTAYKYKADREDTEGHGSLRYGFKAQDVLAIEGDNPVIVDNEDSEKLRMVETSLIPVLVNAIKELTARIAVLEGK